VGVYLEGEVSLATEVGKKELFVRNWGSKWQPHVIVCIGPGHPQAAEGLAAT
jgi:hypothetical protein